ncbi:DsbA family protein [Streptomyces sp.]|uniref:DsbA family protein n=1 Tax=Streptomyces sp. TaxID=1931 RepID=UPI002F42A4C8
MTESKGPDNSGGAAAGPGKKNRKNLLDRLRPYAVGTVAMAVVFGGSALVGAHVRATKEDKVSEPKGAVAAVPAAPAAGASPGAGAEQKLAVPVRSAVPVTVTVYEDLRSPDSKAFDEQYRATFDQLLTTGQVQLHYRLVTASDQAYGGTGAKVAANAAACAQDQGRFTEFVREIWNNQPDPHSDGLADVALMTKLAKKAGKITAGTFEPCVQQADHDGWVRQSQSAFAAQHLGDMPVVQINGTAVRGTRTTLTPRMLRALVLQEARRVIAARATPAATNTLLR